ncbi:MAG: ferritin-like domain-containing protein [Candidatus Carbobacillus altaicus]|nr:ferritin-like domain-containing protein [Candidatus Carbobacillus altaicus]
MPTPPKMVSTKDLLYLKDMMAWQLLAIKRYHHLSQELQNQTLKQMLGQLIDMHKAHYQTLLDYTQINNEQAIQQFNQQMMQAAQMGGQVNQAQMRA